MSLLRASPIQMSLIGCAQIPRLRPNELYGFFQLRRASLRRSIRYGEFGSHLMLHTLFLKMMGLDFQQRFVCQLSQAG